MKTKVPAVRIHASAAGWSPNWQGSETDCSVELSACLEISPRQHLPIMFDSFSLCDNTAQLVPEGVMPEALWMRIPSGTGGQPSRQAVLWCMAGETAALSPDISRQASLVTSSGGGNTVLNSPRGSSSGRTWFQPLLHALGRHKVAKPIEEQASVWESTRP